MSAKQDRQFLEDLGNATLNGAIPQGTVVRLYRIACRLQAEADRRTPDRCEALPGVKPEIKAGRPVCSHECSKVAAAKVCPYTGLHTAIGATCWPWYAGQVAELEGWLLECDRSKRTLARIGNGLRQQLRDLEAWECPRCGNWSLRDHVCRWCLYDPSTGATAEGADDVVGRARAELARATQRAGASAEEQRLAAIEGGEVEPYPEEVDG